MLTLQEMLDYVADDLYPDVDYAAKLNSAGYCTPNAVKLADRLILYKPVNCGLGKQL